MNSESALPDVQRTDYEEASFRRGITHALTMAGDLVRAGASANDLYEICDMAIDWLNGAGKDFATLHELLVAWRQSKGRHI